MAYLTLVVFLACIVGLLGLLAFALLIGSLMTMRARKKRSATKAFKQRKLKPFSESDLGQLPTEIRVLIFKHYFQAHTYILDPLQEFRPRAQLPPPPLPETYYRSNITSLLRTCSKVYHEAIPLVLANTTFKTFLRYESIYDFLLHPPLAPNGKLEHLIIHYRNMANMRLAPIVSSLPDLETIIVCGDTDVIRRPDLPHVFNKRLDNPVMEAEFKAMLDARAPVDFDSEQRVTAVLALARKPLDIELVYHVGTVNNGDVIVYRPAEKTWMRKRLDLVTQVEYGFDEGRYDVPYGRVGRRRGWWT